MTKKEMKQLLRSVSEGSICSRILNELINRLTGDPEEDFFVIRYQCVISNCNTEIIVRQNSEVFTQALHTMICPGCLDLCRKSQTGNLYKSQLNEWVMKHIERV